MLPNSIALLTLKIIFIHGNEDSTKNVLLICENITFETQENDVSFNQVSKLAQTLKKTPH